MLNIQAKHGSECGQNAEVVKAETIRGNQKSKTHVSKGDI